MKSIEDIESELKTEDPAVLKLCDKFLDERLEKERLRGESAERRGSFILGTLSAASAFLVFFASKASATSEKFNGLTITIYIAAIVWLVRSVWYSIKSMRAQSRYQIMADSVLDFQGKSEIGALKDIVIGKLWEHQHAVQPNSERLFNVQRAQRALVAFIAWLLLLGITITFSDQIESPVKCYLTTFLIVGASIFLVFGDKFIEKAGIWNHR